LNEWTYRSAEISKSAYDATAMTEARYWEVSEV